MTIQHIKDLLAEVAPDIQRYDHDGKGTDAYTVWQEYGPGNLYGDGINEGSIRFQVDRFTKEEDEETALAILASLESQDNITVDYRVDYEKDTKYIHHIYDCEGA